MIHGGWKRGPFMTAISVLSVGRSFDHPQQPPKQDEINRRKSVF
jgi:hypothetical protein